MIKLKNMGLMAWVGVPVLGIASGLMLAWCRFPEATFGLLNPQAPVSGSGNSVVDTPQEPVQLDPGTAGEYVRAVRDGRLNRALELTEWMKERLDYVRATAGTPEAVSAAREELIGQLADRKVERNQLRQEGIEDQYILAPGTEIVPIAIDEGRTDLAKPVARRVWFRIEYLKPDRALRDAAGRPIRSIVAGVNISEDECVLKAGVLGNLDLDRASVTYF